MIEVTLDLTGLERDFLRLIRWLESHESVELTSSDMSFDLLEGGRGDLRVKFLTTSPAHPGEFWGHWDWTLNQVSRFGTLHSISVCPGYDFKSKHFTFKRRDTHE